MSDELIIAKNFIVLSSSKRQALEWLIENCDGMRIENGMIASDLKEFLHFYRPRMQVFYQGDPNDIPGYNKIQAIIAKNTKEG